MAAKKSFDLNPIYEAAHEVQSFCIAHRWKLCFIGGVAVQLHEDECSVEDLLDAVHALGARIRMFQADAMDMETAFMKLTEGKTA